MAIEWHWLSIIVVASVLATFMGVLMTMMMWLFLRDRSKSRYDEYRNQAVLSDMRASYEHQLARLNAEMTATEQRWRDANHLLLNAQQVQVEDVGQQKIVLSPFMRELGLGDIDLSPDQKLIFVLTPFSDEEKPTFEVIKNLCNRNGFRCIRGDEDQVQGSILAHIVRMMIKARVIIANISTRNANVFYELGIAHAMGKSTILISRTIEGMPFDIAIRRIVLYTTLAELEKRLTEYLLRVIADVSA
jgi:hypothetical protein